MWDSPQKGAGMRDQDPPFQTLITHVNGTLHNRTKRGGLSTTFCLGNAPIRRIWPWNKNNETYTTERTFKLENKT